MTIAIIICLVVVALGFIVGLARGTGKSVIRLITIAMAVAATFFLAVPAARWLANKDISGIVSEIGGVKVTTASETMVNLIKSNETAAEILGGSPALEAAARQIPVILFSVVTFIVLFLLLLLVSLIFYAIFKSIFVRQSYRNYDDRYKGPPRPSAGSRAGGALIGALCAILCLGMICAPALGLINTMKELPDDSNVEIKKEYYDPVAQNRLLKLFDSVGFGAIGNAYIKSASKVTAEDGTVTYVSEDIESVSKIYSLLDEYGITEKIGSGDFKLSDMAEYLADGKFTEKLFSLIFDSRTLTEAFRSLTAKGGEKMAEMLCLPKDDAEAYTLVTDGVSDTITDGSEEVELASANDAYQSGGASEIPVSESPVADVTEDYAPSDYTRFRIVEGGAVYFLTNDNGRLYIGKSSSPDVYPEKMISVDDAVGKVGSIKKDVADKLLASINTEGMGDAQKEALRIAVAESADKMLKQAAADLIVGAGFDAKSVSGFLNSPDNRVIQLTQASFSYGGVKAGDLAKAFEDGFDALIKSGSENTAKTVSSLATSVANVANVIRDGGELIELVPGISEVIGTVQESEQLNGLGQTILNAAAESSKASEIIPPSVTKEMAKVYADNGDVSGATKAAAVCSDLLGALDEGDTARISSQLSALTEMLDEETAAVIKNFVSDDLIGKFTTNREDVANSKTIANGVLDALTAAGKRENFDDESEALVLLYNISTQKKPFNDSDVVRLFDYAVGSPLLTDIIHRCSSCRIGLSAGARNECAAKLTAAYNASTAPETAKSGVYADLCAILGISAKSGK